MYIAIYTLFLSINFISIPRALKNPQKFKHILSLGFLLALRIADITKTQKFKMKSRNSNVSKARLFKVFFLRWMSMAKIFELITSFCMIVSRPNLSTHFFFIRASKVLLRLGCSYFFGTFCLKLFLF